MKTISFIKKITAIEVEKTKKTFFKTKLEKDLFMLSHEEGECIYYDKSVEERMYVIIDRESGYVITSNPVTKNDAILVIKIYLLKKYDTTNTKNDTL